MADIFALRIFAFLSYEIFEGSRRRGPVFLVDTAHDDLQRIVGQGALQRLGLIPRRASKRRALRLSPG